MSAPNPPYGRRPVGGGPGSPYPTPPGGMPPHGRGPAPAGPSPRGPAPYRPGPYGPPPHGTPPSGTPGYGVPRHGPPPIPGPRPEPGGDPWRAGAPTDRHHPGPPTPAPGGHGTPPPAGPPGGGAGADNPLIPPGVNGVPLPGPVPDAVQRAFLVWLVPVPLNIVAMLLTGLGSGDLGGLGVSIFGVVVALIGGAIGVYLALHFRGGRNWARIVLTVISGLVLAVELFSVPASLFLMVLAPVVGVISLAISVAIAACEVLFLVLAWKAEASAYLR